MGIIFSSFNGLEPKLRFVFFDTNYLPYNIGDIFDERSERGSENAELLSVTMNDGVKKRTEIEGKDNSSEDKGNYKIVHIGDMVYNSMRMWQGANGISPYEGIVSPAYTVLKASKPLCDKYIGYLFKNTDLINKFRKNSQGLTSDTWNLKYPQIATIKVFLPSLSEQEKIAAFLSLVDARIEKQRQLVEALKKYKRGLFLKLYNDSKKKSYKICELGKYCATGALSKDDIDVSGKYLCILYGELFTKYGEVIRQIASRTNIIPTYLSGTNEILFPSSTTADAQSLIFPSSLKIKNIFLGGDLFTIKLKNEFDSDFISYLINFMYKNTLARYSQGITIIHLHYTDIKEQIINIPDIVIQLKISDIMKKIEAIIENNDNKLKSLLLMKKSFLQQMFI